MTDHTTTTRDHTPPEESDRLMTRLLDDEATAADRRRFEELAVRTPGLWRDLALRHQDMARLARAARAAIAPALATKLPRPWLLPSRMTWPLALSGWAAMVIIAVWWGLAGPARAPVETTTVDRAPRLTSHSPEEHYRAYLAAPYVLGDLQPVVVEVEELTDGRIAIRFIRRIEEVAFLDPEAALPVDESGELTRDPSFLRKVERGEEGRTGPRGEGTEERRN